MIIYKAGTVSVTANSSTVTGQGTAFAFTGVAGGLLLVGGVAALIESVESDNSITLSQPWGGDSSVNAAYSISLVPAVAASTVAASARIASLVNNLDDQSALFAENDFASGDDEGIALDSHRLGGEPASSFTEAVDHVSASDNPHSVNKAQVGLGNVDNTSDANKPVSTAVQAALSGKVNNDGFGNLIAQTLQGGSNVSITQNSDDGILTIDSEGGGGSINAVIFGSYDDAENGRWDRIGEWTFDGSNFAQFNTVAVVGVRDSSALYTLVIGGEANGQGVVSRINFSISSNASSFEHGEQFLIVRNESANTVGLYYSRTDGSFRERYMSIISTFPSDDRVVFDGSIVEGSTVAPSGNESIVITGPSGAISANPYLLFNDVSNEIVSSNKIQSVSNDNGELTITFEAGTWNSTNYGGVGNAVKDDSNNDGNIRVQVGGTANKQQTIDTTYAVVTRNTANSRVSSSPLITILFVGDLAETAANTQAVATIINSTAGPAGADGEQGPAGNDGVDGEQGPAGADGADGVVNLDALTPIVPDAVNGRVGVNIENPNHAFHVNKTQADRLTAAFAMTGYSRANQSDEHGVGLYLSFNVANNRQFLMADTLSGIGVRFLSSTIDGVSNFGGSRRDLVMGTTTNGAHVATTITNTQFSVSNHAGNAAKVVNSIAGHLNQTGDLLHVSTYHFGTQADALKIKANKQAEFGGPVKLAPFSVSDAPPANADNEGSQIYVTDGDSGSACLAVSDGSTWRRVSLGAEIST